MSSLITESFSKEFLISKFGEYYWAAYKMQNYAEKYIENNFPLYINEISDDFNINSNYLIKVIQIFKNNDDPLSNEEVLNTLGTALIIYTILKRHKIEIPYEWNEFEGKSIRDIGSLMQWANGIVENGYSKLKNWLIEYLIKNTPELELFYEDEKDDVKIYRFNDFNAVKSFLKNYNKNDFSYFMVKLKDRTGSANKWEIYLFKYHNLFEFDIVAFHTELGKIISKGGILPYLEFILKTHKKFFMLYKNFYGKKLLASNNTPLQAIENAFDKFDKNIVNKLGFINSNEFLDLVKNAFKESSPLFITNNIYFNMLETAEDAFYSSNNLKKGSLNFASKYILNFIVQYIQNSVVSNPVSRTTLKPIYRTIQEYMKVYNSSHKTLVGFEEFYKDFSPEDLYTLMKEPLLYLLSFVSIKMDYHSTTSLASTIISLSDNPISFRLIDKIPMLKKRMEAKTQLTTLIKSDKLPTEILPPLEFKELMRPYMKESYESYINEIDLLVIKKCITDFDVYEFLHDVIITEGELELYNNPIFNEFINIFIVNFTPTTYTLYKKVVSDFNKNVNIGKSYFKYGNDNNEKKFFQYIQNPHKYDIFLLLEARVYFEEEKDEKALSKIDTAIKHLTGVDIK